MNPDAIEAVLRSLQPTPWGWQALIPGFAFLGQPVRLEVSTRDVPTEELPPAPDAIEVALARLILGRLPDVLSEAEQQYRTYHAAVPQAINLAHEPHVWLSRGVLARDGANRWSFVVGIAGAEDYGTHAEFAALSCVGIWSGD